MWKMNVIKCTVKFICCCLIFTTIISTAEPKCFNELDIPATWNFSTSLTAPAKIIQNFNKSANAIEVTVTDARENICISLYAMPFKTNKSQCPSVLNESMDMRLYWDSHQLTARNETNRISKIPSYGSIFTGCYYFILMVNNSKESWQMAPEFYESSYKFLNARVTIADSTAESNVNDTDWIKPGDSTNARRMILYLDVPADCISVRVAFYEFNQGDRVKVLEKLKEGGTTASAIHKFEKKPGEDKVGVWLLPPLDTNITLAVDMWRKDSATNATGYIARLQWKNLESRPRNYYFGYLTSSRGSTTCTPAFTNFTKAWYLINNSRWEYGGFASGPDAVKPNPFPTILGAGIFCVVSVLLILAFWMVKYSRLIGARNRQGNDTIQRSPLDALLSHESTQSNRIMLIYMKGSPDFMEGMSELRRFLKQDCQCKVHDLFDPEEMNRVATLTARGWVEKLLRSGSKVVWVDTPQFRSKLNDPEMDNNPGDFRELAIPYAVSLAADLFQHSVTQYLCHFVVRVEGFEVKDDRDDPLLVVVPHTRYHIPENLPQLCEDLRGPMVRI